MQSYKRLRKLAQISGSPTMYNTFKVWWNKLDHKTKGKIMRRVNKVTTPTTIIEYSESDQINNPNLDSDSVKELETILNNIVVLPIEKLVPPSKLEAASFVDRWTTFMNDKGLV